MASSWSALKVELLETGANPGQWGNLTNVNLGDAVLGEAITGQATVDFATDADVTITLTDAATTQAARNLRLNITESSSGIGSVRNLILGSGCQIEKFYLINNTGTGAKTVKNTSGTGISVPAGKATLVYNNGTNVVDAASYFTSLTLGSALPIASGGTGTSSTTFTNLTTNVTGLLPIANGGTATATPSLVQGANVTITGTWPNQTIAAAAPGTGTVTSVSGTGTVSGLSLSGSVTTSGSLTLSGTLSVLNANTTATNANTASTIVARDASGNFSAGTITASLTGNASGSAATFTSTSQNSQFNSVGVGTAGSGTAGEIRATNNVTAFYSSDIKFKENVRDIPDALATVNAIGGKLFDWKDDYIESKGGADGYFVQKADFGVIAQDVQKVFPIAVRTREDGSLAVDYEKLGALAFAALVELTKRVKALEAK
jgi:hypothetical protein